MKSSCKILVRVPRDRRCDSSGVRQTLSAWVKLQDTGACLPGDHRCDSSGANPQCVGTLKSCWDP